jgi:hypothetical protein
MFFLTFMLQVHLPYLMFIFHMSWDLVFIAPSPPFFKLASGSLGTMPIMTSLQCTLVSS